MYNFNKLKLNEKLCLIAILIEDFDNGLQYSHNDKYKIFKAKDINFDNAYGVSRVIYIMSNFIVDRKSYDIKPNLETLNKSKEVKRFVDIYRNEEFKNKLDILIYMCRFLSENEELKKLNFIDEIRAGYTFKDLALDIQKFRNSL